jgi:hypothetical protein
VTARKAAGRAAACALGCGVLLGAAAGCLNFAEPEPGPAVLQAVLRAEDGDTVRGELQASFRPGTHPDGRARSVAEPFLRILDRVVGPSERRDGGPLQYRADFPLGAPAEVPARVELEGPRLDGLSSRGRVSVPGLWRAGPDSVRMAAGEDLRLPLRGVPEADPIDSAEIDRRLRLRDIVRLVLYIHLRAPET